jgi:replicative DNA helicase
MGAALRTVDEPRRELPFDVEMEQALLGVLLTDNHWFERVTSEFKPEHLYDPLHQRLYDVMVGLWNKGHAVSPLTVRTLMAEDEGFEQVGGYAYLASLARAAPSMPNCSDWVRLLVDLQGRRELIRIGEDVVGAAFDTPYETGVSAKIAQQASDALFSVVRHGDVQMPISAFDLAGAVLAEHEAVLQGKPIPIIPTGFYQVDAEIGGFRGSDFILLPGRSGMGKSVLLASICTRVALAGFPVLIFSLEMNRQQWVERMLCDLDYDALTKGQKPLVYQHFRNGKAGPDEIGRAAVAMNRLHDIPLEILDDDHLTIEDIAARARSWAIGRAPLGLIAIDYLQIVKPTESGRDRTREQEVSHIARGCKALAKKLGWPVLACAQIVNKSTEERRPVLADIRESGAIEMEADMVMFPYRKAWYLEKKRQDVKDIPAEFAAWKADMDNYGHKFELLCQKNRHGRARDFELWTDIKSAAIRDQRPSAATNTDSAGLLV